MEKTLTHINPKLPTFADIKSQMAVTPIHSDLFNVILKYYEASVKVEYENSKVSYFSQTQFNRKDLKTSDILNVDICGILELVDPVNKFKDSKIRNINGNVILVGNVSNMFSTCWRNFNADIRKWDTSEVTNMSNMFSLQVNSTKK